ncbi:MAG: hypothetical protein CBD99_000470 [Candidatus Pelagibacter sp. TMED239]|nr:MAG: hypothetical protein CBD99_000470 [Candidatus Pelagibacter sp. TMED239]
MESFRSFITAAQQTKKCPEGYRFDKKLQVCVPIGVTRYYPYFGGKNGNGQNDQQSSDNNTNGNGNATNGNGNDTNGNGSGGNGNGE